jgi:hypothetical protein
VLWFDAISNAFSCLFTTVKNRRKKDRMSSKTRFFYEFYESIGEFLVEEGAFCVYFFFSWGKSDLPQVFFFNSNG